MSLFARAAAATLLALPVSFTASASETTASPAPVQVVEPASSVEHAPVPEPMPSPVENVPEADPNAPVLAAAASLEPGGFHWISDAPAEGRLLLVVSIPDQKLYVYRANRLLAVSTVSTGKPGHATPTGVFPILEKRREHYSNLYNNAPMPFMQRLTWDGVALHGGKLPGYPASHGCVRLPNAFAERLFAVTDRGGLVVVTARPFTELAEHDAQFRPTDAMLLASAGHRAVRR
ncbi:MAG TPA: L,D-transpeptidase family protein [Sphingomonas sp.]|jgi:lipoprotein-anchoring transpeptidase ErfK/SrfK